MLGTIGEIRAFAGNFAPRTWALCKGQLQSIAQNTALFSIIGTTYGGDGRTTFALPDLRGRIPLSEGRGPGLSSRPLGQRSGTETVVLNQLQIPSHTHYASTAVSGGTGSITGQMKAAMNVSSNGATEDSSTDNVLASGDGTSMYAPVGDADSALNAGAIQVDTSGLAAVLTNMSVSVTNSPTGGSQAHDNIQPYLVVNWIICLQGVYPSRS